MTIAQTRLDQIRDLVNQWEALTGYTIQFNDWAIGEMAGKPGEFQTLYDIGKFAQIYSGSMWWQFIPSGALDNMPWAKYGMSATEYSAKVSGYDAAFTQLTGQSLPQDMIDQALKQERGTMTAAQFTTWLMNQDSIKNTYGWLKYGLDFNQFQTRKLEMQNEFGRPVGDQEAVGLLTTLHAAQGPNMSVGVSPTLTQQERKQANVGVGQSVVR